MACAPDERDAGFELAPVLRHPAREVVNAGARVAIDDTQRRRLALERLNQENQHGVLEHVGMIACMVVVLVAQHRVL